MSAPEKVLMPRWRCVHCRRSWSSKATAKAHATRCWYDPANRACKTCTHFSRDYSHAARDTCAAGLRLPLAIRAGQECRPTLAVGCDAHRVRDEYVNPDVIKTLTTTVDR